MNLLEMRIILLLLFSIAFESVYSKVINNDGMNARESDGLKGEAHSRGDDKMIRLIEEEMLSLNKSDDPARDKRALGVILQGFMEALGYTVSPVQYASLPSGQMSAAPAMMPPAMMPPTMMNPMPPGMPPMQPNASASTPRQRETVRITGVLNFGDNTNTTNLQNHLAQYEQIFHGNRSAPSGPPASPPATTAAPPLDIDPRSRPPLPQPLFVTIPLPIAPNLTPSQSPSPTPAQDDYQDEYYSNEHSDEYSNSKDEEGKQGDDDEEDEKTYHSEEYERKQEQYDGPEDRNYESEGSNEDSSEPREKNTEREYKNSKNVENYQVEKKKLHHPSEVSEEVPIADSKFNHAMFVDEPDWKKKTDDYVYNLAAEQEARVEALAEENAEREKDIDNSQEEEDAEYHVSREKEISSNNKDHESRYESDEGVENYSANDEEEESTSSEMPRSNSERNEAHTTLPISYNREKSHQDEALRDSYGEVLEKPDGIADERVAGYFSMFKNPDTGVYDPARIQEYETSRINFDQSDLMDGFNRIQKEYSLPNSKYEEYEIDDDDKKEHRTKVDIQKLQRNPEKQTTSRKGCNCEKTKADVQTQEAKNSERSTPTAIPHTNYGPYYSTINQLYDPANYHRNIITRLTSYDQPTTVKFDQTRTKIQTIQPTIYPEHLTTMSWLQESEAKEIRAWPSPFDYTYDNSEQSKVILKKSPQKPAPFKPTRKICKEDEVKGQKLLNDFQNERSSAMSSQEFRRIPSSSKNGRNVKQNEYRKTTHGFYTTLRPTEPTIFEQRKRPLTAERSIKPHKNNRPSKHPTTASETRSQYSEIVVTTKRPLRDRQHHRQTNHQARESQTHRESPGSKTNVNKKPNILPPRRMNLKAEDTNYFEKNGILIIPEPTPYYYNEKIDRFTEEPQSDSEKVQIKEYRNRIATVKVSELKQLHPEESTQIFEYTRHL